MREEILGSDEKKKAFNENLFLIAIEITRALIWVSVHFRRVYLAGKIRLQPVPEFLLPRNTPVPLNGSHPPSWAATYELLSWHKQVENLRSLSGGITVAPRNTVSTQFQCSYYYMRNFCNLIGLEQWYFSLI